MSTFVFDMIFFGKLERNQNPEIDSSYRGTLGSAFNECSHNGGSPNECKNYNHSTIPSFKKKLPSQIYKIIFEVLFTASSNV